MVPSVDRRVLRLVGEVMGLLTLDEFCEGLLFGLQQFISADYYAINEVPGDIEGAISIGHPLIPQEGHEAWIRYGHQNPLAAHFMRTRDGRPKRFSDLITRRELHKLEIYMLPSRPQQVLGVALSRGRRDFTVAECELLGVARPYLIQAYRNALSFSGLSRPPGPAIPVGELQRRGLTRRQAEVLRLVAMGRSDQHAADELGIGIRTVQKHLERAYRALGVGNRSEAAGVVWDEIGR
jgi:DNA-binding CsgD family transcriptional regulator